MPAIKTNSDSCSCLLKTTSCLHAVTRSFSVCHACECEVPVCLDPGPRSGFAADSTAGKLHNAWHAVRRSFSTHHACLFYDILVQQRRRLTLILVPSAPCLMQSHAVTT